MQVSSSVDTWIWCSLMKVLDKLRGKWVFQRFLVCKKPFLPGLKGWTLSLIKNTEYHQTYPFRSVQISYGSTTQGTEHFTPKLKIKNRNSDVSAILLSRSSALIFLFFLIDGWCILEWRSSDSFYAKPCSVFYCTVCFTEHAVPLRRGCLWIWSWLWRRVCTGGPINFCRTNVSIDV